MITRRTFLKVLGIAGVAAPVLLFSEAAVGSDKNSKNVVERFRELYADLKSISLSFSSSQAKGTLKAKKGSGFRVELPDRSIVSDGIIVWHAQVATKTVVINQAHESSDEMSIERLFFVLMNVYTPTALPGTGVTIIRLSPPDPSAMIAGVTRADVYLNTSMMITSIQVVENSTITTWNISSLKRNPSLPSSTFRYAIPKGWKVIDLR